MTSVPSSSRSTLGATIGCEFGIRLVPDGDPYDCIDVAEEPLLDSDRATEQLIVWCE